LKPPPTTEEREELVDRTAVEPPRQAPWASGAAAVASRTLVTGELLCGLVDLRAGALKAELLELARRFDVAEDDTLVVRVDYLEVVARTPSWR
jgi:hypothetical protein